MILRKSDEAIASSASVVATAMESEDKNARHTGSASVLHVQHGKIQLCNGMVSFVCACSAMHGMIKTHTTCAHENSSSTHGIFHMKRLHH